MSDTRPPAISVVIPVYNSSGCLPELLRQLTDVLDGRGQSYEVILVDDASSDGSWKVILTELPKYRGVTALRLMRNAGQARATLCGMEHARGETVVTMDDDLQHRPDQLPKLLDALAADPDVDCVFGVFDHKEHAGYRNLGSAVILWINARAFGLPKGLRSSAFRAMRRTLAQAALSHHTTSPAIVAILCECTSRFKSVTVDHAPRFTGRSNYTLARQLRLAWDNICNVSMLPLRIVSLLGFGSCLFSVALVLWTLVRYWMRQIGVPGWTTVIILVSFFAGVTLLALGVMGEYLARVLREARHAPRYVIREEAGRAEPSVVSLDRRSAGGSRR